MWTEVIKFIGGSAVLLASVAWLIRTLIQHFLSKDIEQYKYDIKRQAENELERLKSSLNIEALTHEIRFSKLHNRRADIIEELYKKLIAFDDAASIVIAELDMNEPEDLKLKADKFIDIYYDFHKYFEQNEIYFSEELARLISELHDTTFKQSLKVVYPKAYDKDNFKVAFYKEQSHIQSSTIQIRQKIKKEFRELLGVTG